MDRRLHDELTRLNRLRLEPTLPSSQWGLAVTDELSLRIAEGTFLETERAAIAARAAAAPTSSAGLVAWFEALEENGPGQGDSLFTWLAEEASLSELKWFLHQEVAGEAGFEDLVALTQVKMPTRPKLELARNYWDELGRGDVRGMHGPMLSRLAAALELDKVRAPIVTESIALGNLMSGLAANRRYAYHSIGALGAIELTAPGRAALVNAALKRHNVAAHVRQYFALHATLDIKHSIAWNREVIGPLVADDPALASALAEGALMRLEAGRRCFERYRAELGVEQRNLRAG